MTKTFLAVLLLLVGFSAVCRADTVVLQNGDRLTGTFTSVRNGNLLLKSDAVGDVTIPLAKIQTLTVGKPAVIVEKDRKLARGQVALGANGDWQVTANGATQTVSAGQRELDPGGRRVPRTGGGFLGALEALEGRDQCRLQLSAWRSRDVAVERRWWRRCANGPWICFSCRTCGPTSG